MNKFRKAFLYLETMYGVQLFTYSPAVDKLVKGLIEKHDFNITSWCNAELGGYNFWIENRPYACMTIKGPGGIYRPSRKTIFRCLKKLYPALESFRHEQQAAAIKSSKVPK